MRFAISIRMEADAIVAITQGMPLCRLISPSNTMC
jgi:hypothetical protein